MQPQRLQETGRPCQSWASGTSLQDPLGKSLCQVLTPCSPVSERCQAAHTHFGGRSMERCWSHSGYRLQSCRFSETANRFIKAQVRFQREPTKADRRGRASFARKPARHTRLRSLSRLLRAADWRAGLRPQPGHQNGLPRPWLVWEKKYIVTPVSFIINISSERTILQLCPS